MGVSQIALAALALLSTVNPSHCVYLMMRGQADEAVRQYRGVAGEDIHDEELLRQMALTLLSTDYARRSPDQQLATLLGVGLSGRHELMPLLLQSLSSPTLDVQLAAIDLLGAIETPAAEEALCRALNSPFVVSRLQALYHLAARNTSQVTFHIQALEVKVPSDLRPLFPLLYAMVDKPEAAKRLKQLLGDPDRLVRCATICCLAQGMRQEFAHIILDLSHQIDPAQQEACALALGDLGGEDAQQRLDELAASPHRHVALAAQKALANRGDLRRAEALRRVAEEGDPFAIALLAEVERGADTLAKLLNHPDPDIQLNAAVSLLARRDGRCVPRLLEHVFGRTAGNCLEVQRSVGGALHALKLTPPAKPRGLSLATTLAETEAIRTQLLGMAAQLPEEEFLRIAAGIFRGGAHSMIPDCVALLEQVQTEGAKALLYRGQRAVGAPLVRGYCNLALFRLDEPGPYRGRIEYWVDQHVSSSTLALKPVHSWIQQQRSCLFELSPEETSRLLIESLEALASEQSEEAIDRVLDSLERGDPSHRYALGGLLLRLVN